MSAIWSYIIGHTAGSPGKLWLFGGITIAASGFLGSIFSSMTAAPVSESELQKSRHYLDHDAKRFATAQEQRLSSMIKDMLNDQGDRHWQAAMAGTVIPHPQAENKTQRYDNDRSVGKMAKNLHEAKSLK